MGTVSMKKIYAFEHKSDFEKYHDIIDRLTSGLSEYQQILEEEFSLKDKPKAVVWTTEELATTVFSEAKRIEIPASITALSFYQKLGYDFKNGVDQVDEEGLYRLEKFR